MQFNSYVFILLFLPIVLALYFGANRIQERLGKIVLIAASMCFYAYAGQIACLYLAATIALNYLFTVRIKRHRWKKIFLVIPLCINIGGLLYFKYTNFAIENSNAILGTNFARKDMVLPLGISFITFQQIAYLVSVFRKELTNNNFVDYLVYILYFPKLLMGPMVEPVDFFAELNCVENKKVNWEHIAEGLKIFAFGLFKKVVFADTFSTAVEWGYSKIDTPTSMDWILIILFYTFEIYFDFSGYSDMAVGVSRMFNITLPMNFDSPYKATSIRDFWKRWHISLTKFLTKYIYISLGGNRKGKLFTYLNTMIVFLVSGIWHGANWTFILWGILHGMLSVMERIFERGKDRFIEPVKWFYTFGCVNVLWLLFRSNSVGEWLHILKKILLFQNTSISEELLNIFRLPETRFLIQIFHLNKFDTMIRGWWMLVFLGVSFAICLIPENNYKKLKDKRMFLVIPAVTACVWGILCLSTESVFVYFNF